jgi:hypothetical protein
MLVNARHVKMVPDRKTDVADRPDIGAKRDALRGK